MVLLAYLKFCWRVLFFAGVVLGPKRGVLLAYASKILLAVRQKIPALRIRLEETYHRTPAATVFWDWQYDLAI